MVELNFSVYHQHIESALGGNRTDARLFCKLLAAHMLQPGFTFDDKTRVYLAEALKKIGQGADANEALLLKGRGQIPKSIGEEIEIAQAVYWEAKEKGISLEDAAYNIGQGKQYLGGADTMFSYYKKWAEGLRITYETND